jgi:hypothetical protein
MAPKKYGDHISHDVKATTNLVQAAICVTVDGRPIEEFAQREFASEASGGVLLDGNGNIVRER